MTATVTLGSPQLERFLTTFHDIDDAHESAFAGRLKHLSRQSFPPGVAAGRGTPAQYDADQFFQMLVAAELAQFGVPPLRQIKLVTEAWPRLRGTVAEVWKAYDSTEGGNLVVVPPVFWRVPVEALRYMARQARGYSLDEHDAIQIMDANEIALMLQERGFTVTRQAFIVAHQLVHDVLLHLKGTVMIRHATMALFMATIIDPIGDADAT